VEAFEETQATPKLGRCHYYGARGHWGCKCEI